MWCSNTVLVVVNAARWVLNDWQIPVLGITRYIILLLLWQLSNLIQNSQAVKKVCGPQKGYGEKRCEIQGGGQEMAVMVG